ncbi:MAG TPA: antitoxin Xre/MbcA/ParS toxin-binding domain-containing protein [Polyangiaceae bacterium]|nr:antitoxin Xre/MbcA/ParS toxin-binding domain-containing protein [Polyangiaceae bacterium]
MAEPAELRVTDLLGGSKVLGRVSEISDLLRVVRVGLPYASLEALTRNLGVEVSAVGAVVGIPDRTLARRKQERLLSPVESDRVYRLAYITHLASAVLGGVQAARKWLGQPNRSLGGPAPMSLLDTDIGCRQVEEALLRLNYGLYA